MKIRKRKTAGAVLLAFIMLLAVVIAMPISRTVPNVLATHSCTWNGIDIHPNSCPNSINLNSKGTTPVAILSNGDFDATTVDPSTVEFAGAPISSRGGWAWEDVNNDGLLDFVCHFDTQDLNLDSNSTEATLTCTYDGKGFTGEDSVNIVGP